ncbi:MAG: hypothetical protein V4726_25015 [Verrucomicrobiota bacterium]
MRSNFLPLGILPLLLAPVAAMAGVTSISIINPSFQTDVFKTFPGYSGPDAPITGWASTGGTGINGPDGSGYPFSDDTTLDGSRLAFIQGGGSLSQTVSGLIPGQRYVFQGWFRGRNTPGVPVFSVEYGGQSLLATQSVTPGAAWQPFTSSFIAGSSSAVLSVINTVPNGQDGTLTLDSMLLFGQSAGQVNIWNPSFESGTAYAFPGYEGKIAGWTLTGSTGFNFAGNNPFAPTGAIPDGSNVAFIQNSGSMAQTLIGLTAGQQYMLELDVNSRQGYPQGHLQVKLGGVSLFDGMLDAVNGTDPYRRLSLPWTAGTDSALLEIAGIQNGADSAIAFDNLSLRAVPEPTATLSAALGLFLAGLRRRRSRSH